jgi:hypothetical protein
MTDTPLPEPKFHHRHLLASDFTQRLEAIHFFDAHLLWPGVGGKCLFSTGGSSPWIS